MILLRHLGARVLGWSLLAMVLLLAFAVLAGLVEGARHGAEVALRLGLLEAPVVVLPLAPLAAAVGAGLAAARLQARGEAVALQAMGLSPVRTALIAAAVGLALGAAGVVAQGSLGAESASRALALRQELGQGPPSTGWLWTGQAGVRIDSGLRVEVGQGRILDVSPGAPPDAAAARQARALSQPGLASSADLRAGSARPLVVEAWQRLLRPLAGALLAGLAWLGVGRRGAHAVGTGLALGLGWQALALALQAQAASGLLPAALAAVLPLCGLLAVGALLRAART